MSVAQGIKRWRTKSKQLSDQIQTIVHREAAYMVDSRFALYLDPRLILPLTVSGQCPRKLCRLGVQMELRSRNKFLP